MMDYREYIEACRAVPTVKCSNAHQKAVFTNAYFAACDLIGGLENTLYDYPETDPEYIAAVKSLENHNLLVNEILDMAKNGEYGVGYAGPGTDSQKHYRFAGKKFTENVVEEIVKAMGR